MTQNQSILFLSKLYHPHIGGVENHLEKITQLLQKKGYKVTILTEKFDPLLPAFEKNGNVRIIRMDISRNNLLMKFFVWKYVLTHTKFFLQFDVIHVHDVFYWLYPIFPICFFKKVFITFHGYEGYPVKWKWILHRKIAQILTRGSICVGDFMKKWYLTKPTFVIYGGVSSKKQKTASKDKSAVFFGRLDEQTGIMEYLKAYNAIKKQYPTFKLTIVGDGKLASKIPRDVKHVSFKRNIDGFIASNRFIFVSRYLSMLEALVQHKEIIAVYDTPIKRDYLLMSPFKDYVYTVSSEKEVANTVIELIRKGKEIKKLDQGKKWAEQQTWDKVVKTYLELWNSNK